MRCRLSADFAALVYQTLIGKATKRAKFCPVANAIYFFAKATYPKTIKSGQAKREGGENMPYDVLVIGGGPAGLSAAINVRARGRSVLVVSNPPEENPLWKSEKVDNYLGMPGVRGQEMLETMRHHAETAGVEFRTGQVLTAMQMGNQWYVTVGTEMESAYAVVLAAGVSRGKKFPGEAELLGRGVSYCATCDGMLYRGRAVAVLGYTERAKEEAAFLGSIGCAVTYFDHPKQCEIRGDGKVEAIHCEGQTLPVDAVFLLRPTLAPTDLFPELTLEQNYVAVDRKMATNLPGLFAAGDCTGTPLQVAKAVGEGLIAGQNAAAYAVRVEKEL